MTGWAQVNGRNALSWENRFKLDLEYVSRLSLWFDIKTLIYTVLKVLKRADIQFVEGQHKGFIESRTPPETDEDTQKLIGNK